MSNRAEFGKRLKSHDWYYGYSDDHGVWKRGRSQSAELRRLHGELECPFDMSTLRKWAHNMILEDFAEEAPGEWYRQPRKYKCVAPTQLKELMTRAEHDDITQWMVLGATAEEIAKFV